MGARKVEKVERKRFERYEKLLIERRRTLTGQAAMLEATALGASPGAAGEISLFPSHPADISGEMYERDFTLGLMESTDGVIAAIDAALQRVEGGTYGFCEACEGEIGPERLEALPESRLCITCQRDEESGLLDA